MNIEEVIEAFQGSLSHDEQIILQSSEFIMRYIKRYNEFLEIALQITCDLSLEIDTSVRIATGIEFMRCLDENINSLEKNELTYLLEQIVPATAEAAELEDYGIINPLIEGFSLLFSQYVHKAELFGQEAGAMFEQLFGAIFSAVDNANVMKTEVAMRCFIQYTRQLTSEIYEGPRDEACNYFYNNCLKNLLTYLCSLGTEICNFASTQFINYTIQAVYALFDPKIVKDIYDNECYFDIPDIVCQLLNNFGLAEQSLQLEDAKEYACQILLKYINRARFVQNRLARVNNGQLFIEQWEQKQTVVASIIVREISQCPNFNLFEDHKSLESIFVVGSSLLETEYESNFIHPAAASIIMENATELVQNIFNMIINAANVRMEKFANEDLLVIDCLKPSIDFVKQICLIDTNINEHLESLAMDSLKQFISNELTAAMYQNQEVEAKIFVGILLMRRGLPNAPLQIKVKICLRSLERMQELHPIVFEEASKLLIAVTIDEYEHYNSFEYLEGTTIEEAWVASDDPNLDAIPYILDEMCQIYVSDIPGEFQCRMLSGILSRPVRQGYLPPSRICDLLRKSLLIMLKTEDKAESGGMVTFTKISLEYMDVNISNQFLTEFVTTQPEMLELPELIKQGVQFRGLIENAFNILTMCIDSVSEVATSFENACEELCSQMLAVDFELAESVFAVMDLFYNKPTTVDAEPSLFDVCLQGFCNVHSNDILGEAICYFYRILPRHIELIQAEGLEASSMYKLAVILVNEQDLITRGFGFILLGSLLDKFVSKYGNAGLEKVLPTYLEVLEKFYSKLEIFNTEEEIDPETKRYILFTTAFFFFVVIGVSESSTLLYEEVEEFIEQNQISLCCMSFIAAWAIHDDESRHSSSLRDTLVEYVCLSTNTLILSASEQVRLITWPCLLIARYSIKSHVDFSSMKVPELEFSMLQNTGFDMGVMGTIFSNVNSMSLVFAQIVDQKNLPFWNHTDSTLYGKLARKVGESAEERSVYAQALIGLRALANKVGQAMEQEQTWMQLPKQFIEYIETEINEMRSGDGQNMLNNFLDNFGNI